MARDEAMVTCDERRRVAERLREFTKDNQWSLTVGGNSSTIRYAISDIVFGDKKYHSGVDLLDRLADLIEPSESGQNRDRNQDSVQKESPIVQIEHECDHEALLEQAKELEKCAWYFGLDVDADEPLRDRLKEASEDFAGCARRIREACGEVA